MGSLEKLIEALDRNTAAQEAILKAMGGKPPSADKEDTPRRSRADKDDKPAAEESGRRRRGAAADDDKGGDKEMTAADLKAAVQKFVEVDSDDEYDRRIEKAIDPVLDKADVKELKDLPKKFWQDVLDNIANYGKDSGGSRRRSV